jgi:hypothetical protein
MFSGIWVTVLGLLNGLVQVFARVLEQLKKDELITQGKELQQAEIAKEEIDMNRQQTEILTKDQTREETAKKMEDGSF